MKGTGEEKVNSKKKKFFSLFPYKEEQSYQINFPGTCKQFITFP